MLPLEKATGIIQNMTIGKEDLHMLALTGGGEIQNLLISFNKLVSQRKSTEAELLLAQKFSQGTLDGLTAHICVLDAEGVILGVNQAWKDFAKENGGLPLRVNEGANYLTVCDEFARQVGTEADGMSAGLRNVLTRKVEFFEMEYPCHSPNELRWFQVRVTRLPGEGVARVVVAHENSTTRKRAERQIQAARDYAENLIRSANVMVVELDLDGRLKVFNPMAEHISGYTLAELQGRNWFETLAPRDRYPHVWETFERLSTGESITHFENPILTKGGEERYISWSNSTTSMDGQISGVVSFGLDITDQRKLTKRLAEAQRMAHVGSWELEHATQGMVWSDEFIEILEIEQSRVLTPGWRDFIQVIHPDDRKRVADGFAWARNGRQNFEVECRLLLCNDIIKHVALLGERELAADGTLLRTFGTAQDVTDRVLQEEMIRVSEDRFRTIADYTYGWEYWEGTLGEILYMSPSCERISGYTRMEFIMDPDLLRRVVHPDDRASFDVHHRDLESHHEGHLHFRILTKSGKVLWIAHGCQGVFSMDKKFLGRRASNRDITDLKDAEQAAHHLAHYDPLTGLPNRRLLLDRLHLALTQAKRFHRALAVMFLDLDHFKKINDTLGHEIGDKLLIEVSRRFSACVRAGDTVSRPGGDEFVIILQEISNPDAATAVADKIIQAIHSPIHIGNHSLDVTTSIGIAIYPVDGTDDAGELMKNADIAMYETKQAGRNGYQLYVNYEI